jgi:NADH dehydrogenase/NADH:ubiquinone oxidoreductase subunit G
MAAGSIHWRWICTVPGIGGEKDGALGGDGEVSDAPFESPIKAFHLTNPIARASVTMAECAAVASGAAKIAAE